MGREITEFIWLVFLLIGVLGIGLPLVLLSFIQIGTCYRCTKRSKRRIRIED